MSDVSDDHHGARLSRRTGSETAERSPRGIRRATAVVVAFAAVGLAGCATTVTSADAATPDSIAEAASPLGIAPELVYTTAVDGYDLAPQSVGPSSTDGMSATWFARSTGAMVTIRTERGELTVESCSAMPLWDAPDATVTCTDDGGVWHREGDGVHEYVAVRGGALIQIIGMNAAPQADLLAAAQAVRVPSDAELELLFSDAPEYPSEPAERGDLPENGDGAPIDPVGPGG